jgi:threonine/homoserine/homoserine lactone efflux protein
MLGQIAAFTIAATLVTISPGPDMALIARRAITDGWRRASVTSAGVLTGLLVHATASAIGISAVFVRSATAFTVLKIAGACYLVALGILSFRSARRAAGEPVARAPGPEARPIRSLRLLFVQGFLNNVLNPKPALFYLAFLPQFIEPSDPVLLVTALLVTIHIAIGVVWLLLWAWLVSRAGMLGRRWRARLETVTGAVLVALGVRLATTTR